MAAKIEMLEGVVTHLSRGTTVDGNIRTSGITGQTNGSISSANTYSFRVDGRPVQFEIKDSVSIADGDVVRVAGVVKKGHLDCYAFKNLATNAEHDRYSVLVTIAAFLFILFGIATLFILFGFVILPTGIYMLVVQGRVKKCIKMVAGVKP